MDILLDLPDGKKEISIKAPYPYSIRVAYQTPVTIKYNEKDEEALASTFEDCLIYTNYQTFKDLSFDEKDRGSLVKKVNETINSSDDFCEFVNGIYKTLREGKSDQKAEFALDLIYAIDPSELVVPAYIDEGLKWLQSYLEPEG